MTLKTLRDQIRSRSGLPGSDTLVGFIDGLINERLQHFTALRRFPELFLANVAAIPTPALSGTVPLPTDLQHLDLSSVRYNNSGTFADANYIFATPGSGSASGIPNTFIWSGSSLLLYPQTVGASASVWINYWKLPTTLLNDTDVFPIPHLIETIKYDCINQVARLTDVKLAILAKADRDESWSANQAIVRK